MKIFRTLFIVSLVLSSFTNCKTQDVENEIPFTITEKTYHYWVSGQKGTNGINVKIVGNFNTTNLFFTKIFFQNRVYDIVPLFRTSTFILAGSYSVLNTEKVLFENTEPSTVKNPEIPFDLGPDEALIVYKISGKNQYHKVQGMKKLETVYLP